MDFHQGHDSWTMEIARAIETKLTYSNNNTFRILFVSDWPVQDFCCAQASISTWSCLSLTHFQSHCKHYTGKYPVWNQSSILCWLCGERDVWFDLTMDPNPTESTDDRIDLSMEWPNLSMEWPNLTLLTLESTLSMESTLSLLPLNRWDDQTKSIDNERRPNQIDNRIFIRLTLDSLLCIKNTL